MHISEGVLNGTTLLAGALLGGGGVAIGLRKMDYAKVPEVAVLTSAFFVASLVHVPVGPVSVHLVLNGLLGALLGWMAFPAVFVALTLQALLFQFGGFTTLGVNTFVMGAPAVIVYYLFNFAVRLGGANVKHTVLLVTGFMAGFTGVALSCLLLASALLSTGEAFSSIAKAVVVAHLPVMVIEGVITSFCVGFLKKVKPEVLEAAL